MEKIDKSKFGEVLKSLREKYNLFQTEIAGELEVTPSTITKWEKGIRKPTLDKLQKLSEMFEVSIDFLLGKED